MLGHPVGFRRQRVHDGFHDSVPQPAQDLGYHALSGWPLGVAATACSWFSTILDGMVEVVQHPTTLKPQPVVEAEV